jgi:hypothetical protein
VREEACERERCVRAVNLMWQALEKITNFLSAPAFSLYYRFHKSPMHPVLFLSWVGFGKLDCISV